MIPFYEFVQGANVLRILSNPYQYNSHSKFCLKGKQHFEPRLKCPAALLTDMKCPLCEEGNRCRPRWIIPAVSRKDDRVYLIDVDYKKFQKIRDYARHINWGNPEKYDIDFIMDYNQFSIVAIPNMHFDFDKSKYPFDLNALDELTKPNIQDLEAILTKNYEEVKGYVSRQEDNDY